MIYSCWIHILAIIILVHPAANGMSVCKASSLCLRCWRQRICGFRCWIELRKHTMQATFWTHNGSTYSTIPFDASAGSISLDWWIVAGWKIGRWEIHDSARLGVANLGRFISFQCSSEDTPWTESSTSRALLRGTCQSFWRYLHVIGKTRQ